MGTIFYILSVFIGSTSKTFMSVLTEYVANVNVVCVTRHFDVLWYNNITIDTGYYLWELDCLPESCLSSTSVLVLRPRHRHA